MLDESDDCNLITCQSQGLKCIPSSSLAAESIALLDSIDAGIHIAQLFFEILKVRFLITILTDDRSLYDPINSNKYVQHKRLRSDISAIKETLLKQEIHEIKCINSTQQLADVLTKPGANTSLLLNVLRKGTLSMQVVTTVLSEFVNMTQNKPSKD